VQNYNPVDIEIITQLQLYIYHFTMYNFNFSCIQVLGTALPTLKFWCLFSIVSVNSLKMAPWCRNLQECCRTYVVCTVLVNKPDCKNNAWNGSYRIAFILLAVQTPVSDINIRRQQKFVFGKRTKGYINCLR
jgi:hypothetical protein